MSNQIKTAKDAATLVVGDIVHFSQVTWRVTKIGPWSCGIKGLTYIFGCNPACRPEVQGHALFFIKDAAAQALIDAVRASQGRL